jgi:hypothetical protein
VPTRTVTVAGDILPPDANPAATAPALATAQAFARKAAAANTLRAYKADWTHYSQWCTTHGFVAVPAAPATVGAYLSSLAGRSASSIHDLPSYQVTTCASDAKQQIEQTSCALGYKTVVWKEALIVPLPAWWRSASARCGRLRIYNRWPSA